MTLIRHRQRTTTAVLPHNANRSVIVPKRGLGATFLRARMLVGTDTLTLRGFVDTLYGDLNPDRFAGDTIVRTTWDSDDDIGRMRFAGAGQRGDVESITIDFPDGPFLVPALWSGVDLFYMSGPPETLGLFAYLDGELGNTIPVTFRVEQRTSELAGLDWAVMPDEGFLVDFHTAPSAAQLADYQNDANWLVTIPPFIPGAINVQNVAVNTPTQLFVDIPNGAASPGDLARVTYTPPGGSSTAAIDRITPTGAPS